MGNLKLVVEKVTGLAQINSACAVFSKKITLNDEVNVTFISCIFLKTNEEDEVQSMLGEIFELSTKKIEEAEKEDGFLKSLISARDATCDYLSAKNADLNFAYLLFYRDVCYIVRFGEKVRLLVFDPPEEEEIIIKEGSGPVKAGQIFLVATEKFLSLFDTSVFKKEAEIDLEEIIDKLACDISQEKDQNEIAAAFILAKKELKFLTRGEKGAVFRLRRNVAIIAFVILVFLALSGIYTVRTNSQKEKLAKFNIHLSNASSKYEEGIALIDLNRERARQILVDADKEVKIALLLNQKNEEANKLASEIQTKLKETENSATVDFQTIEEFESSISSLSIDDKNVYTVTQNAIFKINLSDKSQDKTEVAENLESGYVSENSTFVISHRKIAKVDLADGNLEQIAPIDNVLDIAVFIGNVYLLSNGQILNFLRGERQNFEISGLTSNIGSLGPIYTSSETDNLYVIDRESSTLLVIDKDGIYKKAYQSSQFAKASDITINNDETKIYLSTGSKILKADF